MQCLEVWYNRIDCCAVAEWVDIAGGYCGWILLVDWIPIVECNKYGKSIEVHCNVELEFILVRLQVFCQKSVKKSFF